MSCCRPPAAVLSLSSCSTRQAGWPRWELCSRLPKKRMPPPVLRAPLTHPPQSTLGMSLPFLLVPRGLQGAEIHRSNLHMAGALKGSIWQTGVFFLACHFTLPMQTTLYSCRTDPTHSAYGTWGIICRSLTQQGHFSYADFCLHALLFLMLCCFFVFFYP